MKIEEAIRDYQRASKVNSLYLSFASNFETERERERERERRGREREGEGGREREKGEREREGDRVVS